MVVISPIRAIGMRHVPGMCPEASVSSCSSRTSMIHTRGPASATNDGGRTGVPSVVWRTCVSQFSRRRTSGFERSESGMPRCYAIRGTERKNSFSR